MFCLCSQVVESVDDEMAAALRSFCEELLAAQPQHRDGAEGVVGPVTVLAVVGARHVHGLERRLATAPDRG